MRLLNAGPAAPHPPLCTRIKKANPTDIDPQTSSRDGFNIFLQLLACNKPLICFLGDRRLSNANRALQERRDEWPNLRQQDQERSGEVSILVATSTHYSPIKAER